jgi:hypothetical protein
MKAHVLKGSKQEIVESLTRISGDVREAIVFEEDAHPAPAGLGATSAEDIFAEMLPLMVEAPGIDDSRTAIYTQAEAE